MPHIFVVTVNKLTNVVQYVLSPLLKHKKACTVVEKVNEASQADQLCGRGLGLYVAYYDVKILDGILEDLVML